MVITTEMSLTADAARLNLGCELHLSDVPVSTISFTGLP
jgi:hypothetical protein